VIYFAAVFHRASLGVASLQAGERFGVGPAALGTFTVLQVGVYTAMQIPTGLLVDRFGSRRMLIAAALLLGVGQCAFGIAASYSWGLGARAILGLGDALTWISVLRLVSAYFPARQYAMMVSISMAVGVAGNLVSTVPLTLLLGHAGWSATFLSVGLVTVAYGAFAAARLRDAPASTVASAGEPTTLGQVLRGVTTAWRVPGTRLGFWVHFSTMVAPMTLSLLWGFPYLVRAQRLSQGAAGVLLGVLVVGSGVSGPLIGAVVGRRPEWRVPLVVGFLVAVIGVWALLLGWPGGHVPPALLTVAFAVLSLGIPISSIGFALARDYNPLPRVGTATGVVNVGGFLATTVAALGVGLLLGAAGASDPTQAFRVALLVIVGVVILGTWRTALWWRRARAAVFAAVARGEDVPVHIRPHRWDVAARAA
jgi:MFS family permease